MTINYNKEWKLVDLDYSGSIEMKVDGSTGGGGSKTFKWQPGTNEVWYLKEVLIFILDDGVMSYNVFGSLGTALTTGLKFVIKKAGTDSQVRNIKDNSDLLITFNDKIQTGNTSTAFLEEDDYFRGSFVIPEDGIELSDENSDVVKMIVRDDLTGIDRLRSQILIWRPLL